MTEALQPEHTTQDATAHNPKTLENKHATSKTAAEDPPDPNNKKEQDDCRCEGPDKNSQCPKCSTHACFETIKCSVCGKWYHFYCSGLSDPELEGLLKENSDRYICKACQTNTRATKTQKETSESTQNDTPEHGNLQKDTTDEGDEPEKTHLVCPTCHLDVTNNSIECLACENWYHVSCVDTSPEDTIYSQFDTYICSSCTLIGLSTDDDNVLPTNTQTVEEIANSQDGINSPKDNDKSDPTASDRVQPTPTMQSKATQHNISHTAEENTNQTPLAQGSKDCKTCKDRGKQLQKLKVEINSKSTSITTLLIENEKLAHEITQAKKEADLAKEEIHRLRKNLEQKQIDLAHANFMKTQYEMDLNSTVTHSDYLYSLCLQHGINISRPQPETIFHACKSNSKGNNAAKKHQQTSNKEDLSQHYSVPTQNRFETLSDTSNDHSDADSFTSRTWWNTRTKRSPRRRNHSFPQKQKSRDREPPTQSRYSPRRDRHYPKEPKTHPSSSYYQEATLPQTKQKQREMNCHSQGQQQFPTPTCTKVGGPANPGPASPTQRGNHHNDLPQHQEPVTPKTRSQCNEQHTTLKSDGHGQPLPQDINSPPLPCFRQKPNEAQDVTQQGKLRSSISPNISTSDLHNPPPVRSTTAARSNGDKPHTTSDHSFSTEPTSKGKSRNSAQPTTFRVRNEAPARTGFPAQTTFHQASHPVFHPGRASTTTHIALLDAAYHAMMATFQLLAVPDAKNNPAIHRMVTINHHQIIDLVQSSLFMLTTM